MNIHMQVFVWIYVFMSPEYIIKNEIGGRIGMCMFTFLGNYQMIFQGDCIIVSILKSGKPI